MKFNTTLRNDWKSFYFDANLVKILREQLDLSLSISIEQVDYELEISIV